MGLIVVSALIGALARAAFPGTVPSTGAEIAVMGLVFLCAVLVRLATASPPGTTDRYSPRPGAWSP